MATTQEITEWSHNEDRKHCSSIFPAEYERLLMERADVLVTLTGRAYTAAPPSGVAGTPVPATDTVGSGRARVFAYGLVWVGSWERDGIDEPFRLISDDGSVAVVPPGVPWVSILPDIATLTYE